MFNNFLRSDFEKEIIIEGGKFVLKYQNGYEFDSMQDKLLKVKEDGTIYYNISDRNKYYLSYLVIDVPFDFKDEELLKKLDKILSEKEMEEIKINDWNNFNPNTKFKILNSLDNSIRNKIIMELFEMNNATKLKKK